MSSLVSMIAIDLYMVKAIFIVDVELPLKMFAIPSLNGFGTFFS